MQLTHEQTVLKKPKREIHVLCDGVLKPDNLGLIIRLCDAFGVVSLGCGGLQDIPPKASRISRSTARHVQIQCEVHLSNLMLWKQRNDYQVVVLDFSKKSQALHSLGELPQHKPLLIIVGSETHGVSDAVLTAIPQHVHIDMFGKNSSMNVSNALAIALFHFQSAL